MSAGFHSVLCTAVHARATVLIQFIFNLPYKLQEIFGQWRMPAESTVSGILVSTSIINIWLVDGPRRAWLIYLVRLIAVRLHLQLHIQPIFTHSLKSFQRAFRLPIQQAHGNGH